MEGPETEWLNVSISGAVMCCDVLLSGSVPPSAPQAGSLGLALALAGLIPSPGTLRHTW